MFYRIKLLWLKLIITPLYRQKQRKFLALADRAMEAGDNDDVNQHVENLLKAIDVARDLEVIYKRFPGTGIVLPLMDDYDAHIQNRR